MNSLQDIQSAILQLSKQEFSSLREWLEKLEADQWDHQWEQDVKAGKLESLANQAIQDFRAGKCKQL
jgi:hypothetical protein